MPNHLVDGYLWILAIHVLDAHGFFLYRFASSLRLGYSGGGMAHRLDYGRYPSRVASRTSIDNRLATWLAGAAQAQFVPLGARIAIIGLSGAMTLRHVGWQTRLSTWPLA